MGLPFFYLFGKGDAAYHTFLQFCNGRLAFRNVRALNSYAAGTGFKARWSHIFLDWYWISFS